MKRALTIETAELKSPVVSGVFRQQTTALRWPTGNASLDRSASGATNAGQ